MFVLYHQDDTDYYGKPEHLFYSQDKDKLEQKKKELGEKHRKFSEESLAYAHARQEHEEKYRQKLIQWLVENKSAILYDHIYKDRNIVFLNIEDQSAEIIENYRNGFIESVRCCPYFHLGKIIERVDREKLKSPLPEQEELKLEYPKYPGEVYDENHLFIEEIKENI